MQMTQLKLHGDLSYCKVDGHLIFLDIQNDRYFRLTQCLESSLVTYLDDGDCPESDMRRLIERKILIDGPSDLDHTPPSLTAIPMRSAMEETIAPKQASVRAILDTLTIVCSTQLQLKTRSLKQVLDKLVSDRGKRPAQHSMPADRELHLLDAAAAFRSARLYVPIDTCCLLDSIAMVRFLAKRELHANLVFGITADPFSAHCWAQHGAVVLNDALGHALAHAPIKVI